MNQSDVFIEKMVTRTISLREYAIQLLAMVGGGLLAFALLLIAGFYALVFIMGICYGVIKLCQRYNLEFEYIFTNGELDIDRITAKKTRKRMMNIKVQLFDSLTRLTPETQAEYDKALRGSELRDYSSRQPGAECWFASYRLPNSKSQVLLFEPDDAMLTGIGRFVPPTKIKG